MTTPAYAHAEQAQRHADHAREHAGVAQAHVSSGEAHATSAQAHATSARAHAMPYPGYPMGYASPMAYPRPGGNRPGSSPYLWPLIIVALAACTSVLVNFLMATTMRNLNAQIASFCQVARSPSPTYGGQPYAPSPAIPQSYGSTAPVDAQVSTQLDRLCRASGPGPVDAVLGRG